MFFRSGFSTRRRTRGRRNRTRGAIATVGKVKRMIDRTVEKKFIVTPHTSVTGTLVNASPVLVLLNPLAQGTSDNTRIGDRVRCHKLQYSFIIYSGAGISQNICYELIRVKEPRGVAPTYTQIYNSATPSPDDHHNNVNVDWASRFESVKKGNINITSNYAAQTMAKRVSFNISLGDVVTDYSINTLGTIADMDKNAYYMLFWTDGATNASVYHAYYFYFMDM